MRSLTVLRNVVTNYLRFFITGALSFLLTPLMVHLMGDADYGLWVAVFSLTGYFGLFDQGMRPSLVRYVSRDHARGDRAGVTRTVNTALAMYTALGIVTLLVTAYVAASFGQWFRIDPGQVGSARTVVLLAGVSVALGFPFGVFGAVLSGLQRYDLANGVGIGIAVLRALAFVAVLRAGMGIVGLAWASLAMNVLGHALSWVIARRLLPGIELGSRHVTREHAKRIGAYSGFAFVGALATNIAFQTDALVITAFLGAASVTPFALAAGLVDNVRSLVHSATWVLSPTASELETLGEGAKLHAVMITAAKYAVLLSWPVLFGLIIFGRALLTAWVGPRYGEASTLLTILAVPTFIALPQSATASLMFGVSRHRGIVGLSVLNALTNLGLSIAWVGRWGLTGVALGTALPLALVSGIWTLVYGCRSLEMPIGRYLREAYLRPGLVSLAFVVPALVLAWAVRPTGWMPLALCSIGAWLVFAACAWRFALDPQERARWGRTVPGLFGARPARATSGGGP